MELKADLYALDIIDCAVDECLAVDPRKKPETATVRLALLFAEVVDQHQNRIYGLHEGTAILHQALEAFEVRRFRHRFEAIEEPELLRARNEVISIYQEAAVLLLQNVPENPNCNPIITVLDASG